MCMEDIKIGRETKMVQTPKVVGVAAAVIVQADPLRTKLVFCSPSSGNVTLSLKEGVTAGVGLIVPTGLNPFVMSIEDFGQLVTMQWYAIGSAGGLNMSVFEGRLERKN